MTSVSDQLKFYGEMAVGRKTESDMDSMMFLQGQSDCQEGKAHKSGKGESYDRGYATQYEWEQVQEAMSRGQ